MQELLVGKNLVHILISKPKELVRRFSSTSYDSGLGLLFVYLC